MKLQYCITLLFIAFASMPSAAQVSADSKTYYCQEIGWTITLPKGWPVLTSEKVNELNQKGKDAIEKEINGLVSDGTKNLIAVRKDRANGFIATIQPFTEGHSGQYQEANKKVYDIMYNTYLDMGIKADTSSATETINGLVFYTFNTVVYSKKGDIILYETLYSRLINGYDFGMTICYNNKHDKATLVQAVMSSRFKSF